MTEIEHALERISDQLDALLKCQVMLLGAYLRIDIDEAPPELADAIDSLEREKYVARKFEVRS